MCFSDTPSDIFENSLTVKQDNGIIGLLFSTSSFFGLYMTTGNFTCSTCEMRVDDLVRVWIQIHEHLEDEFSSRLSIFLWTCKNRESVTIPKSETE